MSDVNVSNLQQGGLRTFMVERLYDESNVSGTGIVMEGIVFSSGQVVVHWLRPSPDGSITVWPTFAMFMSVHVTAHPANDTRIHWSDGVVWRADDMPDGGIGQWTN